MKRISAGPPLRAIGDETPPDSARPAAPAFIVAGIMLAGAVAWLSIASTKPTRLFVRADLIISDLFPKDAARWTDANGNALRAR